MYQSSGYFYTCSIDPASFGTGFTTLMNGFLDVTEWFIPTWCGTVTHVEALAFRVGSPAHKPVNYELWRPNSGANLWAIPTSGGNWELLCTALLQPQSLSGTTPVTATWISMPVDTPVFIDNRGGYPNSQGSSLDVQNVGQSVVHGYALKITRTAANSDGSGTNMVRVPYIGSHDLNPFGTVGGLNNARLAGENAADTPVRLYGLRQVNSQFLDAPMDLPYRIGVTSFPSYASTTLNSGFFKMRGHHFTAVGSKISRAMFGIGVDWTSSGDVSLFASIWTIHANSVLPDTCIGSSHVVYWWGDNVGSGDAGDTVFPFMFTFSGGIDITSGTTYAAVVETETRSLATTRAAKFPATVTNQSSYRIYFYDTRSSIWGVTSGRHAPLEIFYVDSATFNAFSGSVGGGGGGAVGAFHKRLFPSTQMRWDPADLNGRSFPLD